MKFAPMKKILNLAEERNVAYGAYVTVSYETALAVIEAGSELDCPVIFITGTDCCDLMGGFEATVDTVKRAAANTKVPIALHLDHCLTYEECVEAINAGYSSVMIDGSALPFEENIKLTKKVVDYAHTPDGLEKILGTAREITEGKIIAVFGCGGDRDRMKRPIMGSIAAEHADISIVTSDNPRTEDPEKIIEDVVVGVEKVKKNKPDLYYEVIADRRQAIKRAVSLAKDDDIVIIAGKGHEDYQILKDRKKHETR